MNQTLTEGIKL